MKKMELNAGNTIFKKGDPADGLYIVGEGFCWNLFSDQPYNGKARYCAQSK